MPSVAMTIFRSRRAFPSRQGADTGSLVATGHWRWSICSSIPPETLAACRRRRARMEVSEAHAEQTQEVKERRLAGSQRLAAAEQRRAITRNLMMDSDNDDQINEHDGLDIAVIGLACRFPANDSTAFWATLRTESITVSGGGLRAAGVQDNLRQDPNPGPNARHHRRGRSLRCRLLRRDAQGSRADGSAAPAVSRMRVGNVRTCGL